MIISELREDKLFISQKEINKTLGLNIKNYRTKFGLTIKVLSKLCGIKATHLGLVERGVKGLSLSNIYRISRLIRISVDKLLFSKNPDYL